MSYTRWPRPVDWPLLIAQAQAGGTMAALARTIGIPKQTIHSIVTYQIEPVWPNGERLVQRWMIVTGRPADEIPRRRAMNV